MVAQEGADPGGALPRAVHPQFERLEAAQQHPGGVGVADRADGVAHHPHLVDQLLLADQPAGDEVAVPAGIFGQAVDAKVGALGERLGPQRPEEGVVDRDRRQLIGPERGVARRRDRLDIDQHVGRVGRAFEVDQRHPALGLGFGNDGVDLLARRAGGEVQPRHPEPAEDLGDQSLGSGVGGPE